MLTPHTHPIRFRDVEHALRFALELESLRAIDNAAVSIANDGWRGACLEHARRVVFAAVHDLDEQQRALVIGHAKGIGYSRAARMLHIRTERAGQLLAEGLESVADSLRATHLLSP